MTDAGTGLRILLAGASGLVGGLVLERLLQNPRVSLVVAPGRRRLAPTSSKLLSITSALDDPNALAELDEMLARVAPALDVFVCCLGTTLRKAGSKPAFLAVDRDLVLRLAMDARTLGVRHVLMVSSVGASAQSDNFYLRVKGETERALFGLGFERIDILRPGLLLGQRQEHRPAEALAQQVLPWLNPILRGGLQRYRSIRAEVVASAVSALLDESEAGQFLHHYPELAALSARSARCAESGPAANL